MHDHLLIDILTLLCAAVIGVVGFRLLRLPPVLGYLSVGVLIGPHGLAWLVDAAEIRFMAELGVMFLMFMLGLEFSWPTLWRARGAVFAIGGGQVAVTALIGGLTARALGLPLETSVIVGGAIAMSSTAILLKQMTDQGDLNTRHGRMVVGVLLFQDLATLPFLVALPIMATAQQGLAPVLLLALAKATAVFITMVVIGRQLTTPIMHWVAASRSAEIFLLASLLLIFAAAAVADVAGLSMPLGAFLAGMVLGETPFRHQIQADIRPFQDVLLGLFFVTIGMQLDMRFLIDGWPTVLALLAAIVLIKPAVVLAVGFLARHNLAIALRSGLALAHVGEFGLLLVSLSMREQLLSLEAGQILLTTMVLSMALAPLFVRWNYQFVSSLNVFSYRENLASQEQQVTEAAHSLSHHVVLCGYGRVGQSLARFLELEGLPYVALDLDPECVAKARGASKPVLYGDAGRFSLLEAAGVHRAQALVISFDELKMAIKILQQVRQHRVDLPILVRAMDVADLDSLRDAGATEVLPEALEVSIFMGAQLLLLMGVPHSRVEEHMEAVRGGEYRLLPGLSCDDKGPDAAAHAGDELQTAGLSLDMYGPGQTLATLGLRELKVEVIALRRGGIRIPYPPQEFSLRVGDILVLSGRAGDLAQARYVLSHGPDSEADEPR
ncbi:MAG: cation:proton antiporter [Gammaproteobacteria bacterium]